jgi:hypothetical protein
MRAPTLSAASKRVLAAAVRDEFERPQHADAAHLADDRQLREGRLQPVLEIAADIARLARQILALDDVEHGVGRGRADRMPGIGIAVREGPDTIRAILHDLVDLLSDDRGREREIGRGQALRDRDQVRLDAIEMRAEGRADAAEAGHDLVGDQQHIVFAQHRAGSPASNPPAAG